MNTNNIIEIDSFIDNLKIKTPKEFANFVYKKFIRTLNKTHKPIIYYD